MAASDSNNNGGSMEFLDDMIPSSSSSQQQQHLHARNGGGGTTTTTFAASSTSTIAKKSVDDAKYDRRIKQRLLLRNQRKLRQQNMKHTCYTVILPILIVLLSFIFVSFYFMSFYLSLPSSSSSSASPSSLLTNHQRWISKQKKIQEQVVHHHLQEQQDKYVDTEKGVIDTTHDKIFEQLRSLFVWKNSNHQQQMLQSSKAARIVSKKQLLLDTLDSWLRQEHDEIHNNIALSHPRWIRPYLLPPIRLVTRSDGNSDMVPINQGDDTQEDSVVEQRKMKKFLRDKKITLPEFKASQIGKYFRVERSSLSTTTTKSMKWQDEYNALLEQYGSRSNIPGPIVDYTNSDIYTYPPRLTKPPPPSDPIRYPPLQTLEQLMTNWPQNSDYNEVQNNNNDGKIKESLQHFDYQNATERAMGILFRDAELPFKFYNVPEVEMANKKWTDEYVGTMFGGHATERTGRVTITTNDGKTMTVPTAHGTAQESRDNYFAFYVAKNWDVETMGLAPTRNIQDWNYTMWSNHAIYADAVRLPYNKPHFYWQSGIPPDERHLSEKYWTFISRDLPIFSSPKDNDFVFHVDQQKGIQCRFGERGVVAATHYDSGRNMIAMITGAKRYILSPPNQCSKLGIFTKSRSPIYRHSLLDFGHIQYLQDNSIQEDSSTMPQMSVEERAWLHRAASSQAVETVLKQGEVLYIPSHWFHYIVSLQKSAQCNVRSGIDLDGTSEYGGRHVVETCIDEE